MVVSPVKKLLDYAGMSPGDYIGSSEDEKFESPDRSMLIHGFEDSEEDDENP